MDVQDFSGASPTFLQITQILRTLLNALIQVETWQEEELFGNSQHFTVAVPRVCVVLANGHRVFYKYDCSRKKFTAYSVHSKHFVSPDAPRNDDQPCCFVNGRFVRVNRDSSRFA